MAKTKVQKEEQLSVFSDRLSNMKSAVIVDYQGLKVKETESLRRNLRSQGVDFKVAKVSLAKIALKNQGIEVDEVVLDKPVAFAFGMQDEVAPAKELAAFAKDHEALEILGGILENKFITTASVRALAALPSREQLYGQVVGTIAAPLSGLVNVLAGNIRGFVNVLNARKESIS